MNRKIILVDMDGVLADFEKGFFQAWKKKFPTRPLISPEKRETFCLSESFPGESEKEIRSIFSAPGFFDNLDIISGAKEALGKMQSSENNVLICTSPISEYANCVLEKYRWVAKNLGPEWTKKIIMTRDKTLAFGDILIDDKPEHRGLRKPSWEHVLFDAPYNQHVKAKLRITWNNWEKIFNT